MPGKSVAPTRGASILEGEHVHHRGLGPPDCLMLGQEIERKRIARELHDDISQRLAVLSVSMSEVVKAAATTLPAFRDQLRTLQREVERLSRDLHRISHNLHPTAVAHRLPDAIRQLCRGVSEQMHIDVEFISDDSVPDTSEEAALALYRVTQEALSNVARHSRSTSATVSLLQHAGKIQLTITDTGVGFDTTRLQAADGLGLTSIRERASMLGAALEVRSVPSAGTTIDLRVPVRTSHAASRCADQPRPRVLLGDDHRGILTALERLITPSCDVVGCATDGAAILDAVAARHPDVVVLDVNMPSMDGLEVCRRLAKTAHTRTVMLTASDDSTLRDAALAAGAAAFVVKSRVADDLLPAILNVATLPRLGPAAWRTLDTPRLNT